MAIEWKRSSELVEYDDAVAAMESRVERLVAGDANEMVWVLEHPPIYTAGTSADEKDLIAPDRFPVYHTGRGGQFTYHGPGIMIAYVMLDLKRRNMQDVKKYVNTLEQWIIDVLNHYGIKGTRRCERVGIWVPRTDMIDDKIAAIGIRVRRWVTFHGIAININPDLSHFEGIVPCGVTEHGITSFEKLGHSIDKNEFYTVMKQKFAKNFS